MTVVPETGQRAKAVFQADLLASQRLTYSGAGQGAFPEFVAYANPGVTATNAGSVWSIKKFIYNDDNPPMIGSIVWASGVAGPLSFNFVWDDRETYTYE